MSYCSDSQSSSQTQKCEMNNDPDPRTFFAVHEGDYYRLLTPGEYEVTARQDGYEPQTHRVSVTSTSHQQAQRVDFRLTPLPAIQETMLLGTAPEYDVYDEAVREKISNGLSKRWLYNRLYK